MTEDKSVTSVGVYKATETGQFAGSQWMMMMATFKARGSVLTLTAPTDGNVHVATGTPITVKIGSNATTTQQGVHWITNPSSGGTYTITLGGTSGNAGNFLVAIGEQTPGKVVFDAVGPSSGGASCAACNSLSWSHTTAGSNRLLTVGVVVGLAGDLTQYAVSVTYNGVAMTSSGRVFVNGNDTNGFGVLFYLLNPAAGTNTVQVTLSGSNVDDIEAGSVSFTGVDQTIGVQNKSTNTGNGTSASTTVTSTAGNMVVDVLASANSIATSGQTLRWKNNQTPNNGGGNGAQSTAAGASAVSMNYAITTDHWAIIGMDVVAATAPIGGLPVQVAVAESLAFTVSSVPAFRPPTFVQGNFANMPNDANPTIAFSSNNAAGNLIVFALDWNSQSVIVNSITDTNGNTYVSAAGPVNGQGGLGSWRDQIFYAKNIGGGANTVTVHFSGAVDSELYLHEYSGADKTSPLDVTASSTGNSSIADSGSRTTNFPNELVFGYCQSNGESCAQGTNFATRRTDTGNLSEDMIATSTGSYSASANLTGVAYWIMSMATFKPAPNCTADDGATVNAISTSATAVPFGTVTPNTFYQGCQDLAVATNAGGGYSVAVQENHAMMTADGRYSIPDTTCDNGLCTAGAAAAWGNPAKNGFGHTCANQSAHDCNSIYSGGINFRQFANVAAPTNDWYNSAWLYRKRITIPNTSVSGTAGLANFPALISRTDEAWKSTPNGGHVSSATGWDFVVTAGDGVTKLNHEIEKFASSTGELVVWAQVPFLSTTSANLLYIYYGNSAALNQSNKTAVWDSNYKGVWHLSTTSTLNATDSTSNGNNGTNNGAAVTAGQVDGAGSFNGSSNYINIGSVAPLGLTGTMTVCAWFKAFDSSTNGEIISNINSAADTITWAFEVNRTARRIGFLHGTTPNFIIVNSNTNFIVNAWTYGCAVRTGSSGSWTVAFYLNGASDGAPTGVDDPATNQTSAIGRAGANNGYYFNGSVDEIRVSNTARSSGWIQTEYNNQSSPSTFTSFGNEEQQGSTAPVIMSSSTPAIATGRIKFRLSAGTRQPAGTYTNTIVYTITGTF
jgi:hypothetical protein